MYAVVNDIKETELSRHHRAGPPMSSQRQAHDRQSSGQTNSLVGERKMGLAEGPILSQEAVLLTGWRRRNLFLHWSDTEHAVHIPGQALGPGGADSMLCFAFPSLPSALFPSLLSKLFI